MKNIFLKTRTGYSYSLLALVFFTTFIIDFFPLSWQKEMYSWAFIFIYLNAAFAMGRYRKRTLIFAVIVMIIEFGSELLDMKILSWASKIFTVLFFVFIVFNFIFMIARSKQVSAKVILESINGYLLLGLLFSIMVAAAMLYDPASFRFPDYVVANNTNGAAFTNYMYFALVTMTTLGYGDIVPVLPYAKSLATFTSISGQLYLTIIIAMLVGKYLGQASGENISS